MSTACYTIRDLTVFSVQKSPTFRNVSIRITALPKSISSKGCACKMENKKATKSTHQLLQSL